MTPSTNAQSAERHVAGRRRVGDTMRIAVVLGWIVWGSAYAYWRELASPVLLGIGGVTVYPSDVLIVATILLGHLDVAGILLDHKSPGYRKLIAGLVGVYSIYVVCVVWAGCVVTGQGAAEAARVVAPRLIVFLVPMVMGLLQREPQIESTLMLVPAVASVPLALGGVINAVTGSFALSVESGFSRVRLLWGGSALFFSWPILVGLVGERAALSRGAVLRAVSGVAGLLMTNHRSAYIALLTSVPFLFRTSARAGRRLFLVLAGALGIVLVVFASVSLAPWEAFGYSIERLLDFASGNGADRLMRWRLALETFWANPFNDIAWTRQWYLVDLSRDYGPHNWVLEVAVSEGVVGIVFYWTLFATVLLSAWRWTRADGAIAGLSAYVAFFLVFCLFNTNFYATMNQPLLWLACGLLVHRSESLLAASRESDNSRTKKRDSAGQGRILPLQ